MSKVDSGKKSDHSHGKVHYNKIAKLRKSIERKLKSLEDMDTSSISDKKAFEEIKEEMRATMKKCHGGSDLKTLKKEFRDSKRKLKNLSGIPKKSKEEKKAEREERKRKREAFKTEMDQTRVEVLPDVKEEIHVIIDGWNIAGCDSVCRKLMRGKKRACADRLIMLSTEFKKKYPQYKVTICFDYGKGDKYMHEDSIQVDWSGEGLTVDDMLVERFTKSFGAFKKEDLVYPAFKTERNPNRLVLVVTSDRELTVRFSAIGVTCMKSGGFYKHYLKQFITDDAEDDDDDHHGKKHRDGGGKDKGKHKHGHGHGGRHHKKFRDYKKRDAKDEDADEKTKEETDHDSSSDSDSSTDESST